MIVFQNIDNLVPPELNAVLSPAVVQEILYNVADAAHSEWVRLAQQGLNSTRRDYIHGIQPVRYGVNQATITLVGTLPNLIEKGMRETDMHDTLLGPNVPVAPPGQPGKRRSKDGGFYRSIPFRHTGPNAGKGLGTPMGSPYHGHEAVADAKKLGRAIQRRMRKLAATTSAPGVGTNWGERLPGGLAPKLRPYHATDIYAGAVRQAKTYKKVTQNQYTTFRTIAVDSHGNPKGSSPWVRSATPGHNFATKVQDYVEKIAPQAFADYVKGLQG